jgi:hypothetical protein
MEIETDTRLPRATTNLKLAEQCVKAMQLLALFNIGVILGNSLHKRLNKDLRFNTHALPSLNKGHKWQTPE